MRVSILKNWGWPSLERQTPGNSMCWGGIDFIEGYCEGTDYILILNGLQQSKQVICSPDNIWAIIQEPPTDKYKFWHQGNKIYAKIYTTDPTLKGKRHTLSHAALPWHVNKTYDELKSIPIPLKSFNLSWVTSNKSTIKGHQSRLHFLNTLKNKIDFDLFGRGFNEINDKWEALAPYRYSLAIENFSNTHYWTEKISDCFLSWSMPIYFGCIEIEKFFPPESLVKIDINDENSPDIIREAVENERWKKNFDAIVHARNLVLDRYNIFPFITQEIKKHQKNRKVCSSPRSITIPPINKLSLTQQIYSSVRRHFYKDK